LLSVAAKSTHRTCTATTPASVQLEPGSKMCAILWRVQRAYFRRINARGSGATSITVHSRQVRRCTPFPNPALETRCWLRRCCRFLKTRGLGTLHHLRRDTTTQRGRVLMVYVDPKQRNYLASTLNVAVERNLRGMRGWGWGWGLRRQLSSKRSSKTREFNPE